MSKFVLSEKASLTSRVFAEEPKITLSVERRKTRSDASSYTIDRETSQGTSSLDE